MFLFICRLGNEKYKSRVVWRSLNPRWLEQFDLHLYDDGDQQLELTVWDKDRARDDFIGRYKLIYLLCIALSYTGSNYTVHFIRITAGVFYPLYKHVC